MCPDILERFGFLVAVWAVPITIVGFGIYVSQTKPRSVGWGVIGPTLAMSVLMSIIIGPLWLFAMMDVSDTCRAAAATESPANR